MRVVITGATGMVGSTVTRTLAADPAVGEVVGVARRVPATPVEGVTWQRADMRRDDLAGVFAGADAVVHLAWMIHPAWSATATWAANVGGADRVLRAAARANVGVVVYASSLGAYAPGPPGRGPVDESWPTTGIPSLPYGREKAALEAMCGRLAAERPEMRVVRLRAGFVMHGENAARMRRVMLGPLMPRAATSRKLPAIPWVSELMAQGVHAGDFADAFRRALVSDARAPTTSLMRRSWTRGRSRVCSTHARCESRSPSRAPPSRRPSTAVRNRRILAGSTCCARRRCSTPAEPGATSAGSRACRPRRRSPSCSGA